MEKSLLELEQLGTGWWVGFSFPWCANLYNTLGNGNAAYEKLRIFVKGFLSPNGFHLNGDYKKQGFSQWHYRPFTLEALYSYCDSVQSMLVEDYKGYIELFPALPDEWENASFDKLICLKGIKVSARLKDKQIKSVILETNTPCAITIRSKYLSKRITIDLKKGKNALNF